MTAEHDSTRCSGIKSAVNPTRPASPCVYCARRDGAMRVDEAQLMKPAAKHDGVQWKCSERLPR